jgi:hypothetical protein
MRIVTKRGPGGDGRDGVTRNFAPTSDAIADGEVVWS